jgi:hypothetical protein
VDVDDIVFEDVCEEVELTKTGPEGVKKLPHMAWTFRHNTAIFLCPVL